MVRGQVLVYNFNEQSDSSELIGGFRPVDNVMQLMSELVAWPYKIYQFLVLFHSYNYIIYIYIQIYIYNNYI